MKKIAFITDGWERYVTYAWIEGYRRYTAEHPLTADLYVFHSFGNFSKDQNFNTGEYNIIQLPDLSAFDGIILDLANILNVSIKEKITELAAKASVPVVSLMEKIPGMYFSGIDNQSAVRTLVEHLITRHHCRTINYIHGPESSYEDQQRFLAYRDKDLLPDAFVCANDNIAVGVCLAAEESGYKIPNDFLITGFDNENKASFFNPRITTVGFSKAEVMYNALRLFHDIWNDKNVSDHIYAPVTHVFQESCRCTPANPADRGQYVANSIMSEVHQNDMQNWMMELDRYLLDCTSFTELAEHLHTWLSTHGCGNLPLLMNPDIFLLEKIDALAEIPDDLYLDFGYPKQMTVVYPYSGNEAGELDLSTGKLLPEVSESDIPNVDFFAPVHFREREIGYLVLENCDYLLTHQFLFETLNTFRTSIEALYGKLILRKKNRQLSQLYIHDSLTGLYNRMAYEKLALPVFNQYMKSKKTVGIMFIDADHLKYINDTFGHDMGNLAISSIASVIRQHCPANSVSMRYGGDEFVCVIPDYDQTQMQKLKQNLLDSLTTLSRNSRMAFPIEASIGFVVADNSVFSLNDYINLADEKMYVEKKERKATRQ
ncbi:GGDEF domain-containing protein [Ruminococcus sp. AF45-4BH]|nr:GGDEF domain-containing protein [Ruminococcus sp. AF45-4BH]